MQPAKLCALMLRLLRLMPAVVTCLIAAPVFAQPLAMGSDLPYRAVIDPGADMTASEAQAALTNAPRQFEPFFSRGYVSDVYWLGFDLPASAFDGGELWLELGPNFVDDIQLFYRLKASNDPWRLRRAGDLAKEASDLDYRYAVFFISEPEVAHSDYEFVVRIHSSSSLVLFARFWQPEEFLNHASRATAFWSFYLGVAALSSLLALILAIVMRTRLLSAAAGFSVTYLLVACVQGFPGWILSGWGMALQHYLTSALTLASYAMLMWLSSETIDLRRYMPKVYGVLLVATGLTLGLIMLVPLDMYATAVRIKTGIYFIAVVLFLYALIHVWVKRQFSLSHLLLGASPVVCMVASLFSLFSVLAWISFKETVYVIWQYALLLNVLLVLAIGTYRIREQRLDERDKQQLSAALNAEREASFNQRQFMAMVSHEFRTPLAIISGTLENLRGLEDSTGPRVQRYEKIHRATERLIQLTDNCLADARLAAGNLYLEPQPVDLLDLAVTAASLVHVSESHQFLLTLEGQPVFGPARGYQIEADSALLRIAVSNVLDNAVKYSSEGCVHIDCSRVNAGYVLRISDDGPGIDPLLADTVFERYWRGTTSRQGTGLGLYFARQIMRAHGGTLELVQKSRGACFEFFFPTGMEARSVDAS